MKCKLELESISKASDDEVLRRLRELLQQSRRIESEVVAHIGEVDRRRLYASEAASSMFVYCTEVLHLSEAEAYLRIEAARAARKHPMLLEMLGDGRLHLSGIAKLAPHLTEANRETLLARAAGLSKRKIEELVAEIRPRPDVPPLMRKLPERRTESNPPPTRQLRPDGVVLNLSSDRVAPPNPTPAPAKPAVVEPLAPARFKILFTASAKLHDKLTRLRALMRSSVPDGDLAAIIEAAVTEKLERLESRRFGTTKAPRKSLAESETSPSSRYIPKAVRRSVRERDRDQCTFVDSNGRHCTERERLEFHHVKPFGRGGEHGIENVCLMCKAHNGYFAERDYGKRWMKRYRRLPDRVSESPALYGSLSARTESQVGLSVRNLSVRFKQPATRQGDGSSTRRRHVPDAFRPRAALFRTERPSRGPW